jgi:hypothetical protein
MLPITEKLPKVLLQKPVEIAHPVQPPGMDDHAKSRIGEEWVTNGSRFSIIGINRDDGFEIAESLLL